MYEKYGQFIDGQWCQSSDKQTYDVINPATEEIIGKASKASPEDVDRALKSSEKGLNTWKKTPPWQRASILRKIADTIREKRNVLAKWMTLENGKPLAEGAAEVNGTADIFEWNAEETKRIYGQTVESRFPDTRVHVYYQPVGVVAALSPWNFPLVLSSRKIFIKTAKGANAQAVLEYTLDALSFASEKKVGLIGEGHIGGKLKKVLSFFNYETITFDPYKFENSIDQKDAVLRCPIISVNASYSKKGDYPSHNLISNLEPEQMLINTSRGEVVDYKAIMKNTNAKLICDVWNKEPNLNVDDIGDTFIGTPHIAGNTLNSKTEALNLAIDSLKEFFETNDLNNLKPINKMLNLDKFLDIDEIKEGEIPFKFIKRFIDIESISDSFKKDLNLFNGRDSFSNFFQAVRKKNERMGFRDYLLSTKLLSDEKKELLTLLGFKIHEE